MTQATPATIEQAAEVLLGFLKAGGLTKTIAALDVVSEAGITLDLLAATMAVRAELGRMSDLIHAAGIVLALPHSLEVVQVERARTDPNFYLYHVDRVAQGNPALFRLKLFGGEQLARLLLDARERRFFELPLPVAEFDAAPRREAI